MSENKSQLATFRIEPELWESFKVQARKNRKTASNVLTDFIQNYVEVEGTIAPTKTLRLDNLDTCIDEKVGEAIAPIQQELAQLRAMLEEHQPGKSKRAA